MGKLSLNVFALSVLVLLFMSATAPVYGAVTSTNRKIREEYNMILQELVREQLNKMIEERKGDIMQPSVLELPSQSSVEAGLTCVGQWGYCDPGKDIKCCSGWWACIAAPSVGGFCLW